MWTGRDKSCKEVACSNANCGGCTKDMCNKQSKCAFTDKCIRVLYKETGRSDIGKGWSNGAVYHDGSYGYVHGTTAHALTRTHRKVDLSIDTYIVLRTTVLAHSVTLSRCPLPGTWGNNLRDCTKRITVPAGVSKCTVKWRSWNIASRDDEQDRLYINGRVVWRQAAPNNCGSRGWRESRTYMQSAHSWVRA